MVSLDIVIVNWNSGKQLCDSLSSIVATEQDCFELSKVIIVDNASTDGSANQIQDVKLPLTIIQNTENQGFGAACNKGAKHSKADYLLFLNPDTRLFEDSLAKTIQFMEQKQNKRVGICGVQLVNDNGQALRTCARFPTPRMFFAKMLGLDRLAPRCFPSHFMTEWNHGNSQQVDQVMGAFFLVRRSLFEYLGGFDERFFVYFEEVDFSFRAIAVGSHSYYLAEAQAYHKGGGTSEQVKATRLFYSLRSRILYGYKHFNWWAATGLALGTLLIEPIARLVLSAVQSSGEGMMETLKGYTKLWRVAPGLLRWRERNRL